MVPNINPRGHSFKGVTAYLLHDKGAATSERVAWTSTHNLHMDDVEEAAGFMAWTDMNRDALKAAAGNAHRGAEATLGNVLHYSLSWKDGQTPSREEMERAAHASIERLGLQEHQYYLVAHNDTDHAHVHIVANLVHPTTGRIQSLWKDYKTLDRWANEYEKEHGEIVCAARAKKYEAWAQNRQAFSTKDRKEQAAAAVNAAFHQSDSGKAFAAALEQDGLSLARGKNRAVVVVDAGGKPFAINRLVTFDEELKGAAKNKAIVERLKDIDRAALPWADTLKAEREAAHTGYLAALEQRRSASKEMDKAADHDAYLAAQEERRKEARRAPANENRVARQSVKEWEEEQRENLARTHATQRQALRSHLKAARKSKDEAIANRWREHIEENRKKEEELKAQLAQKGLRGIVYRFRHGAEARDDIERARKSRLNAESRQAEEMSVIDKSDRRAHARMSARHLQEERALQTRIDAAHEAGEIPKPERRRILAGKKREDELNIALDFDLTVTHE